MVVEIALEDERTVAAVDSEALVDEVDGEAWVDEVDVTIACVVPVNSGVEDACVTDAGGASGVECVVGGRGGAGGGDDAFCGGRDGGVFCGGGRAGGAFGADLPPSRRASTDGAGSLISPIGAAWAPKKERKRIRTAKFR